MTHLWILGYYLQSVSCPLPIAAIVIGIAAVAFDARSSVTHYRVVVRQVLTQLLHSLWQGAKK